MKMIKFCVISLLMVLFCSFSAHLRASGQDILFTIANDVSTPNTLEFDLLLLDSDPSQDFELCTVQAGIFLNPNCFTGGTVTSQILAGTSMLNASQAPTSITFTNSAHIIKLAAKAPPGCNSGTIISKDPLNPTRICRIRLTNNISWVYCTTADLSFCFATTPYPTKISYYPPDCVQFQVTLNTSNCYSTAANQSLITPGPPQPISFLVTGSGSYCQGGSGLPVGLSNSEPGVIYTLYKDGIPQIPTLSGTGAALNFGAQEVGTYTVFAQRMLACGTLTSWMTGSANITYYPPTVGGSVNGPDSAVEGCTTVTINLTGQTGNVLKWQKRLNGGSWTDILQTSTIYSEIPTPTGNWEYRAVVRSGDCDSANSSSWLVTVQPRTLTIKCFLQGLYRVTTGMMDKAQDEYGDHYLGDTADLVDIGLAHNSYPYGIEYNFTGIALPQNGILTLVLPSGSFMSYFLVIRHRNSVETWSSFPLNLSGESSFYNFTNGVYKAYGYNMMQMGDVWVFFTGDVDQDGIIDSGDMISVDNLNSVFAVGYLPQDNNGDGVIDSTDMSMIGNNSSQFIGSVKP